MHDYAGRILHDDKMRGLYREAAESSLAALARPQRLTIRARASRWLRGNPLAHSLRGRLGPTANPKLAENA